MGMEIAIVDDIPQDRDKLAKGVKACLARSHMVCTVALFSCAEDFLQSFDPQRYAAVFLDILMNGISGMEVAKRIRAQGYAGTLVFITTEREYALDGYTVQALDYLIKPFDPQRLCAVMERIIHQFALLKYIEVRENRLCRKILLNDILYAEARGHYIEIHTLKDICRTYMTFDQFQSLLQDEKRFLCCFRGIVVNLDQVERMEKQGFLLRGGDEVPVSRARRAEMREAYANYAFEKTRGGYP